MREQAPRADAAVLRVAARIVLAAERFAAELEVRVGRRDPAQLRAVVAVLVAEERLIRERTVDEIVGVRVVAVEIADVREEAAGARLNPSGSVSVSMYASSISALASPLSS